MTDEETRETIANAKRHARKEKRWYFRVLWRAHAVLGQLLGGLAHAETKSWLADDLEARLDDDKGEGEGCPR